MKIEKGTRKVRVICLDGSLIIGHVHTNAGERLIDFLNKHHNKFILITDVELFHGKETRAFRLLHGRAKPEILINRDSIKLLEEV